MFEAEIAWLTRMTPRMQKLQQEALATWGVGGLYGESSGLTPENAYRQHHLGANKDSAVSTLAKAMELHGVLKQRYLGDFQDVPAPGLVERVALEELGRLLDCPAVPVTTFEVLATFEGSRLTFEGNLDEALESVVSELVWRNAEDSLDQGTAGLMFSDVHISELSPSDVEGEVGQLRTCTVQVAAQFKIHVTGDVPENFSNFIKSALMVKGVNHKAPAPNWYLNLQHVFVPTVYTK